MCGRYVFDGDTDSIKNHYKTDPGVMLSPHFNIAPGMMMPIIIYSDGLQIKLSKWGLLPSWIKDLNLGYSLINTRSETILEKPMFKKLFLMKRCLVPASGFYEWKHDGKKKIPYYFYLKNIRLFSFSGLYETGIDAEGKIFFSYSIITTTANDTVLPVHHRMPVILSRSAESEWLDPNNTNPDILKKYLIPFPVSDMGAHPVSSIINNPKYNDKKNIIEFVS